MATRVLLLLLSTLLLSYALRVEIGGRAEPPRGWSLGATPPANQQINFVVFVKQQNFAALEEKFLSVSNPDSPEYGQFLTLEEAESIIAPKEEHMEAVEGWLTSFSEADVQRLSDRFEVRSTVAAAEQILGEAQFYTHTNDVTGRSLVRANGKITIPEEVSEAVDFVAGITELGDRETIGKITARREASPRATVTVTPELLRKFYNIPEKYQVAKSKKTFNGIAAFNDDFQQPGFDAFKTKYNLPKFDTVRMAGNGSVADYVESDLDVQYISAMSQGTDLLFLQEPNTFWILQFLMDASKLERVPTVFSISYGWFETDQCLWATVNCPKLGYSGPQYVNRTNTAFQVFGATGVSIFIASGDDGSPSPYCPIDPYVKGMYGPTACAAITISNATANMSCSLPYITGRGTNDACDQVYEATQNTYPNLQQAATQALAKANPDCGIPTGSSYGVLQSKCICSDLQSVNLGGWDVSGYEVDPATIGHIFAPIWPGSSPYVTSVGATYFVSKDGVNVDSEVPSDVIQGANFEGGGGFSYFQKGLEYQQEAVKSWLTKAGRKAPPAWSFSPQSRGYPDISFNGNNYDVYFDQFNHSPVSGTSASSPATAGLFNLINDVLFQNGKTQLGFLNPLLYKMAREYPKAFNDLTHGDNRCDGGLCCLYGFVATEGWDPVSGLGTPNFEEILKYVSKVKRFQL